MNGPGVSTTIVGSPPAASGAHAEPPKYLAVSLADLSVTPLAYEDLESLFRAVLEELGSKLVRLATEASTVRIAAFWMPLMTFERRSEIGLVTSHWPKAGPVTSARPSAVAARRDRRLMAQYPAGRGTSGAA